MGVMKTPGVYIVEQNAFPNSVVEVATAVPAFIGYTQKADNKGNSLHMKPRRITSMAEFHQYFGMGPTEEHVRFSLKKVESPAAPDPGTPLDFRDGTPLVVGKDKYFLKQTGGKYLLYYSMLHFYQNGGGPCYVVSVGTYSGDGVDAAALTSGIAELKKEQEPTMVVIPEAVLLDKGVCYALQAAALQHCGYDMKNRVAILDVWEGYRQRTDDPDCVAQFRDGIGVNHLDFGAAYYPWVNTTIVQEQDLTYQNIATENQTDLVQYITDDLDGLGLSAPVRARSLEEVAKITSLQSELDNQKAGEEAAAKTPPPAPDAEQTAATTAADAAKTYLKAQIDALTAAQETTAANAALQKINDAKPLDTGAQTTAQTTLNSKKTDASTSANAASGQAEALANAVKAAKDAAAIDEGVANQAADKAKLAATNAPEDRIAQDTSKSADATVAEATELLTRLTAVEQTMNEARDAAKIAAGKANELPAEDAAAAFAEAVTKARQAEGAAARREAAAKARVIARAAAPREKLEKDKADLLTRVSLLAKTLPRISPFFKNVIDEMRKRLNVLPPAAAMAGIYTMVDNSRGVWKAPANVSLNSVTSPTVPISSEQQEDLNVTAQGKSINAIRAFIGEGTLVWGGRTLDGNSLDWRYINVRRTMIMLEESIRLAGKALVFEPNVANTWVNMKAMIGNFLTGIWRRGGLAGAVPADAFSVHCGLGETMTADDILEGIMRVTVLVAISRPAEFIEITFQQQMQKS